MGGYKSARAFSQCAPETETVAEKPSNTSNVSENNNNNKLKKLPARFFGVTADKPPRTTTRAGGESRANTNGWRVHGGKKK